MLLEGKQLDSYQETILLAIDGKKCLKSEQVIVRSPGELDTRFIDGNSTGNDFFP